MEVPASATYANTTLPTRTAVAMKLHCNLTESGLACFDTEAEAVYVSPALAGVIAAASCSPAMTLYDGTSFTGFSVAISVQSA